MISMLLIIAFHNSIASLRLYSLIRGLMLSSPLNLLPILKFLLIQAINLLRQNIIFHVQNELEYQYRFEDFLHF